MLMIEKYLGERYRNQWKPIVVIIGLVILFTHGFNYINWNPTYGGWLSKVIYLFLALFFFLKVNAKSKRYNFSKEINLLILLPFLSIINSWYFYSQSIYDSITTTFCSFVWVIYYILPRKKVSESTILRIFLYVALLIVAIQIVQQFTYPNALFGIRSEEYMIEKGLTEIAEQRNGLWRFRMHQNAYYTVPILFSSWIWLQNRVDKKLLLLVVLLLVSVYLTLTRQVMFSCALTILISYFMGRQKINKGFLILGLILIIGLYVYYDILFSSLAEQTAEDTTEDNIRILAAAYFWNESIRNPLVFLLGCGIPVGDSMLGQHIAQLQSMFGFYTSDVGFIGQIYEKGVIYVILCYYIMYRVFFKLKNIVPTYIRMFVSFVAIMSPMIFPIISDSTFLIWSLLLYVCDVYINQSKVQQYDIRKSS